MTQTGSTQISQTLDYGDPPSLVPWQTLNSSLTEHYRNSDENVAGRRSDAHYQQTLSGPTLTEVDLVQVSRSGLLLQEPTSMVNFPSSHRLTADCSHNLACPHHITDRCQCRRETLWLLPIPDSRPSLKSRLKTHLFNPRLHSIIYLNFSSKAKD